MKKNYFSVLIFSLGVMSAQQIGVGINTDNPQATLDVSGHPNDTSMMDGIIAPRITGDLLHAKTYTSSQKGALIYVTEAASTSNQVDQTVNVIEDGYYYFDGDVWVKVNPDQSSNQAWMIEGNSNTDNTNFLGTTNEQPLIFKVNNVLSGYLNKNKSNTSFGYGALSDPSVSTGSNVAFGYNAMRAYKSGYTPKADFGGNVALGSAALEGTEKSGLTIAIGQGAMSGAQESWNNTAIGNTVMYKLNGGSLNVGIGGYALRDLTKGNYNIAIGVSASQDITTGSGNVAIGYGSGKQTTGSYNITIGGQGVGTTSPDSNRQLNIGNLITGTGLSGGIVQDNPTNQEKTKKIGIAQQGANNITEVLDVNGTARVRSLPNDGDANAIYTNPDGSSSESKNQTFTATKTVVVDDNGVLGVVEGTPVTKLPPSPDIPKTIQYVTKTALVNNNTPKESEIKLGNLAVRYNGTNPRGGEQSVSLKLLGAKDLEGNDANADNIICNGYKVGSGGGPFGQQNTYFSAVKGQWNEVTESRLKPNINNNDFAVYNILLLNTREVYRLTISINTAINGSNVNSAAQVTFFMERLSNADGTVKTQ